MKRRFLAGVMAFSFVLSVCPAKAAMNTTEIILPKDVAGNPVFTTDANGW